VASKRYEDNKIGDFLGQHLALLKKGYSFSGYERDKVWLQREGHFVDVSGISGADSISDGRAAIFWDYDDDGDLDILLRAMHGPATFLFRNRIGQAKPSIRVELVGKQSGRDAFGSVVRMRTNLGIQSKVKQGGGRYCAQSDPRLLFGLGDDPVLYWIEVTWPNGKKQRMSLQDKSLESIKSIKIAER
jgi:hypothetical protein